MNNIEFTIITVVFILCSLLCVLTGHVGFAITFLTIGIFTIAELE